MPRAVQALRAVRVWTSLTPAFGTEGRHRVFLGYEGGAEAPKGLALWGGRAGPEQHAKVILGLLLSGFIQLLGINTHTPSLLGPTAWDTSSETRAGATLSQTRQVPELIRKPPHPLGRCFPTAATTPGLTGASGGGTGAHAP